MVVSAGAVVPRGEDAEICLSTGQSVPLRITQAGDTLVGPDYISLRSARPLLDFAGVYAAGAFWYENGDRIEFERSTPCYGCVARRG